MKRDLSSFWLKEGKLAQKTKLGGAVFKSPNGTGRDHPHHSQTTNQLSSPAAHRQPIGLAGTGHGIYSPANQRQSGSQSQLSRVGGADSYT